MLSTLSVKTTCFINHCSTLLFNIIHNGDCTIISSLAIHRSLCTIAAQTGRSSLKICREISRNGGMERYWDRRAVHATRDKGRCQQLCKLVDNPVSGSLAARKLRVAQTAPVPDGDFGVRNGAASIVPVNKINAL
jgi:hypothetical protein